MITSAIKDVNGEQFLSSRRIPLESANNKINLGPEEHELEREPSFHYINQYYEYGSPYCLQGS